ncbi:MAG: kelch repeat-containing protein [Burkholderiales bacterium]|nr:kelch repeat-containing protein [Burkholderiales bacterium]
MPNGEVLVAGGSDIAFSPLASAEVYDPATNAWTAARALARGRVSHTATLLPDGKVLFAGGNGSPPDVYPANAELYDPATISWIPRCAI